MRIQQMPAGFCPCLESRLFVTPREHQEVGQRRGVTGQLELAAPPSCKVGLGAGAREVSEVLMPFGNQCGREFSRCLLIVDAYRLQAWSRLNVGVDDDDRPGSTDQRFESYFRQSGAE